MPRSPRLDESFHIRTRPRLLNCLAPSSPGAQVASASPQGGRAPGRGSRRKSERRPGRRPRGGRAERRSAAAPVLRPLSRVRRPTCPTRAGLLQGRPGKQPDDSAKRNENELVSVSRDDAGTPSVRIPVSDQLRPPRAVWIALAHDCTVSFKVLAAREPNRRRQRPGDQTVRGAAHQTRCSSPTRSTPRPRNSTGRN